MTKEEEIDLICKLLSHSAEFSLDVDGCLSIYKHENLDWVIEWEEYIHESFDPEKSIWSEEIFTDALEAAKFFVEKRYEIKAGEDFRLKSELESIKHLN